MYAGLLDFYNDQKGKHKPYLTSKYVEISTSLVSTILAFFWLLARIMKYNYEPIYCPPVVHHSSESLKYHCKLESYFYQANGKKVLETKSASCLTSNWILGTLYPGTQQIVNATDVHTKIPMHPVMLFDAIIWGFIILVNGHLYLSTLASNFLVQLAHDMTHTDTSNDNINTLASKFLVQLNNNGFSTFMFHLVELCMVGSSVGYLFLLDSLFGSQWLLLMDYITDIDELVPILPDRVTCLLETLSVVPGEPDSIVTLCYLPHNEANRWLLVVFYCGIVFNIILGSHKFK